MSTLQTSQFSKLTRKSRKIGSSVVDSISISNLYSLVKEYDNEYILKFINVKLRMYSLTIKIQGLRMIGASKKAKLHYPSTLYSINSIHIASTIVNE